MLIITLASCTSDSMNPFDSPQMLHTAAVDVYVAGRQLSTTGELTKAVYWKNNIPTYLTDGTHWAGAEKIRVVGDDVYVLGNENNDSNRIQYKLWKNGLSIPFITNEFCVPTDFWVDGVDVYVVGKNENGEVAYWKNGVQNVLTNNDGTNMSGSIKVVNGDVYIPGYDILYGGALYWKNGTPHPIEAFSLSPMVPSFEGIEVIDSDVYVLGNYAEYNNDNSPGAPQYGVCWKNGVLTYVGEYFHAKGISVSFNDVFITGTDNEGACYFKNEERFALTDSFLDAATEVKVLNNNVYVSGIINNPKTGVLWINGVQSTYPNAYANDLFVVQN